MENNDNDVRYRGPGREGEAPQAQHQQPPPAQAQYQQPPPQPQIYHQPPPPAPPPSQPLFNTLPVIIAVMLVGFCLFSYFSFYFGGLMEELKTLKNVNAELIKTKDELKNELARTRNECNVNREKDMATCKEMMKTQDETYSNLLNKTKEEAEQNAIENKQEKEEKTKDARKFYYDWTTTREKHYSKCDSSLSECRKKLDQRRDKENAEVTDLTKAVTQCKVEISFKISQLESCEARLNNSIAIMKGKGIEVI
uniref:Uncharacterized protein n=1 Tax=Amphimedon queenslandica TaxID=400682 RepID=A0A1X7SYG7_AMPQE